MAGQLESARAGVVTEQVAAVAEKEGLQAEFVREQLAAGRLVIPANKVHKGTNLEPAGIGRALTTKVNANIGTSSVRSSIEAEIEKMQIALEAGADAIMDLSTGGDLDKSREELLAECPVPFGTVPIYQVIIGRDVEEINQKIILQTVEKQAKQGVDF
ncbi:MAG: phosphomethylpyrimidine synthase ThiC, partial [Planctomycetota bacterium]